MAPACLPVFQRVARLRRRDAPQARRLRLVLCLRHSAGPADSAAKALLRITTGHARPIHARFQPCGHKHEQRKALTKAIASGLPCLGRVSARSEEHTYELQSLMRKSYAVSCLKQKQ